MSRPTTAGTDDAGVWITLRESSVPVRALLAGVLLNQLGGFLQTFLVLFLTERGFSAVQAGTALGGYGAGCFAGVLIGGAFSDRLGARAAAFASMAGFAGLLVVVLYVSNFAVLLTVLTLAGLVGRFFRPAAAAMLSELTPPHRQVMIFAIYRLAINVGTTAAPLLGALLISVSYQLLFWCDAATALLYAVIALLTLPGRPARPDRPDRATRRAAGYRAVLVDRRYCLFLLATLVNCAVYIQYVSTLPLAMKDRGLAMIWYSVAVSLNGLMVISCELLLTKVTQRLRVRLIVSVGFGLLALGQLMYALPWGVWVFLSRHHDLDRRRDHRRPHDVLLPRPGRARRAAWSLHRRDADHVQPRRGHRPGARCGGLQRGRLPALAVVRGGQPDRPRVGAARHAPARQRAPAADRAGPIGPIGSAGTVGAARSAGHPGRHRRRPGTGRG